MDSNNCVSSSWIIIVFMFLSIWKVDVHGQNTNFVVTDFGAIADGATDSRQAFLDAWNSACQADGGVVSVPQGTFLVSGSAAFKGPCNGQTGFSVDGTVVASDDPTLDQDYWITFHKVDGLTVSGYGVFDGNGASSWSSCNGVKNCNPLPPTTMKINYVTNSAIHDINLVNSKMFHLLIHESENLNIYNVTISAPEDSPNTDGIHTGSSNGVNIFDSHIGTGDDCISMGDGSRNVNISGVWCGPGHGISIGSLGKYEGEQDVSGITVTNCTLTNTDNGLRIKTWAPSLSSTVVSDVTYTDINVNNVKNPIIIDQYYCPGGSCSHEGESNVAIKGVKFINIRGSSASETGVSIQCSKSYPCQDIELRGLELTFKGQPTTASCSSADGIFQGTDQVPSQCSSQYSCY
ncbi:UNVERIFIED_CONTAM: Exopolygalacturonase [Sesamum latifolium]|uniref:Exopolygalacturonase n=1 Tax=Sesamum latifolium TaxID=2727402 RepID=A0AAW2TK32_9LAMI